MSPRPLIAASARERLAADYLDRHHEVEGWLGDTAAQVTARLLQRQSALGLHGNVLEIGVHHGRYFLVLATGIAPDETAVAIDAFAGLSDSQRRAWLAFVAHVRRFAPHVRVEVMKANSTRLDDEFVRHHIGMRFISVDGGHDRATACSDLRLAERLLRQGGIVALDDVYRPDWSGVTAGLARYFGEGSSLVPVAFIPNKLLLTSDAVWAETYRDFLRQEFAAYCSLDHPRLEVFEHDDVLLLWSEPRES